MKFIELRTLNIKRRTLNVFKVARLKTFDALLHLIGDRIHSIKAFKSCAFSPSRPGVGIFRLSSAWIVFSSPRCRVFPCPFSS